MNGIQNGSSNWNTKGRNENKQNDAKLLQAGKNAKLLQAGRNENKQNVLNCKNLIKIMTSMTLIKIAIILLQLQNWMQ